MYITKITRQKLNESIKNFVGDYKKLAVTSWQQYKNKIKYSTLIQIVTRAETMY